MKHIVVVIAGASDQPTEELGGKTPFELAKIPNLNHFSKIGRTGQVKLLSDKLEASSDVSLINLLGYDADKVYTGRGPIEAANLELTLEKDEIAFRMNFITEAEGVLSDPTGGHISSKESHALIEYLNTRVASDFVRFFPGSEHRHIAVIKDSHGFAALSAKTTSPYSMVGKKIDANFPNGPGEELLKKLMFDARLLLKDHEINQVRVDLKENPANMIWLWGQGKPLEIEGFSSKNGLSGAVVTGVEFVKGIGRIGKLTVMESESRLIEEEEDYDRMSKLLLDALEEKDFVLVYINGCDESSRLGDSRRKISTLEATDYFILSSVREYLESSKDVRVLVTSNHCSPWKTRDHVKDSVPFVLAGKNILVDDIEKFSETASKASEFKVNSGSELMKLFLAK